MKKLMMYRVGIVLLGLTIGLCLPGGGCNMRMSRVFNKMYANMFGYFWIPCPRCGEYFGGHEWKHTNIGMSTADQNVSSAVCTKCALSVASRHPGTGQVRINPETMEETAVSSLGKKLEEPSR